MRIGVGLTIAFYPLCRWFARVKERRSDWWLQLTHFATLRRSSVVKFSSNNGRSGWDPWIVREATDKTIAYMFAESFFRYMAFPRKEQGIELAAFNVDKDAPRLDWIHNVLDATNPDMTAFRDRKSKLLMYFGWADQSLNAQMGVDYYESVLQKMGPTTKDFFRLFMQPACSIAEAEWERGPSIRYR